MLDCQRFLKEYKPRASQVRLQTFVYQGVKNKSHEPRTLDSSHFSFEYSES